MVVRMEKLGRYVIANQILPSLKPTPLLKPQEQTRSIWPRHPMPNRSLMHRQIQKILPLSPDPNTCPSDEETLETKNHILGKIAQDTPNTEKALRYPEPWVYTFHRGHEVASKLSHEAQYQGPLLFGDEYLTSSGVLNLTLTDESN